MTRRETATTRTTSLLLNTEKGAFKDPKARAAAREAINTSASPRASTKGTPTPASASTDPP